MKYALLGHLMILLFATKSLAQPPLAIRVNSNEDAIAPDGKLTLREAIKLSNGTLTLSDLTAAELAQTDPNQSWRIAFQLPRDQQTIFLQRPLSPLEQPGLTLAGKATLTPAPETTIPQGLILSGDEIRVQGLKLYGFRGETDRQRGFPAANLLIAPSKTNDNPPPQGIVIEENQLGSSQTPSAFGIAVFAGRDVVIRNNHIQHHQGSGVLTMVNSVNLKIANNAIAHNGKAGMADGIRLAGKIDGTTIVNNQIANNGGSGIYLFKPEGATVIENNQIVNNSQRRAQAAIFLMGSDHQVLNNKIENPRGAGVVVAAYPTSIRNIILDNRFENLDGLSIDLITRRETTVRAYDNGDGKNPPPNSLNRNRDTANRAIASPEFLAPKFYLFQETVPMEGTAMPHAQITLYRVGESSANSPPPLLEPLAKTQADAEGRFGFELTERVRGAKLSAIATHPEYGTSEPADEILIQEIAQSDRKLRASELKAVTVTTVCCLLESNEPDQK